MSDLIQCLEDAICNGGTPVAYCGFCGKVYYNSNGEFMDENELDDLEKKRVKNPKKYIPKDGTISHGHFAGREYVWGCRCAEFLKYADFIWYNRFTIADYFRRRSRLELVDAQTQSNLLNQ